MAVMKTSILSIALSRVWRGLILKTLLLGAASESKKIVHQARRIAQSLSRASALMRAPLVRPMSNSSALQMHCVDSLVMIVHRGPKASYVFQPVTCQNVPPNDWKTAVNRAS
jgi:hypothetical protein